MNETPWVDLCGGAVRARWDEGAQGIEIQRSALNGPGFRDDATVLDALAFAARGFSEGEAERAGAPVWYRRDVRDSRRER